MFTNEMLWSEAKTFGFKPETKLRLS